MPSTSKIEWTDVTWNPVRGCTKVSPGCKHCYAETFAERFRGVPDHPYEQGFDLKLIPEKLLEPLKWTSPKTVFVNSMSDLFQDGVPDEYIGSVINIMKLAKWHTYQVLTKRSERMRDFLNGPKFDRSGAAHIWWGVSVEDREHGVPRIEHLRATDARIRFLSIEPLLMDIGRLDLEGDVVTVTGAAIPRPWQRARPGVLEIADQYWPYQRSLSADSLSSTRSAQTLYVEAIGEMLLECPCIRCRYSTSDRRLAA